MNRRTFAVVRARESVMVLGLSAERAPPMRGRLARLGGGAGPHDRDARGVAGQEAPVTDRSDLAGTEESRGGHVAAERALERGEIAIGNSEQLSSAAIAGEQQRACGAAVELLRREQQLEILARGV